MWHLGGGLFFPLLAFFISRETLILSVGVVTAAFLGCELVRLTLPPINRWMVTHLSPVLKEQKGFRLTGSTYFLIASLLVFLLFEKPVAVAALLFVAVGDPLAATVGERFGRKRLFGKSLEGSMSYLLSSLAVGMMLVKIDLGLSPWLVLVGAASAALIELMPIPIDDNLVVPLFCAATMTLVGLG